MKIKYIQFHEKWTTSEGAGSLHVLSWERSLLRLTTLEQNL